MNPDLKKLQPYPFEKLASLKQGITPPADLEHIALSIGEPKHPAPGFISEELITHLHGLSNYPLTRGKDELRQSITDWLVKRFNLPAASINAADHVLPVNGTREALFAFAQCVVDRNTKPVVMMPNPFYQIYEGAALLAGAEPYFLNTTAKNNYLPDLDSVDDETWQRCQLLYLCSPGNPTGAVMDMKYLKNVIELAERFDFVIASDECYSEIYLDDSKPPPGLLGAAAEMGNSDYQRCIVFHSLSKRSNVPGLRSGFVAGDKTIICKFLLYRTYHGCAMSAYSQAASIKAWQDEKHVIQNRALYREKFDAVIDILNPVLKFEKPSASFYLWPETPIDDESFARDLFAQQNVTVLPGSYLSREAGNINPGTRHVRMALVAPLDECIDAANRLKTYIQTL